MFIDLFNIVQGQGINKTIKEKLDLDCHKNLIPEAEDHKCKSGFSNGRLKVLVKCVSVSVFLMRVEFLSKV